MSAALAQLLLLLLEGGTVPTFKTIRRRNPRYKTAQAPSSFWDPESTLAHMSKHGQQLMHRDVHHGLFLTAENVKITQTPEVD